MSNIKKQISYFKRKSKIEISRHFEKELFYYEKKRLKKILSNNEALILIYTIGKVGSSSVYNSLKQNKLLNIPVFHIHALDPKRIKQQREYYKSSSRKSVPFHLIQSAALGELLEIYSGKVFVFSLIREPIQRELSSIFQDSFNFTASKNVAASGIANVIHDKFELLAKELPEKEWFDRELHAVFGFDIFDESFDISHGYTIRSNNKARLAFCRLENLNANFDQICKEWLQTNLEFDLESANLGDDKFYDKDYQTIKNEIRFPQGQLDKIVKSPFIQKFYPDYIETIKQKWGEQH